MDIGIDQKPASAGVDLVTCRTSQGLELRATVLRLLHRQVCFEIYDAQLLRLSEVLGEFKITMNGRKIYFGNAVVSRMFDTGAIIVCEAGLDESGFIAETLTSCANRDQLRASLTQAIGEWGLICRVYPEFKMVIADMQVLFADLRRWMEQVEFAVRARPSEEQKQLEREILLELEDNILCTAALVLERFEEVGASIDPSLLSIHKAYMQRQIHHHVLCSPFLNRTFQKPLGYAGDYEMVNMMLGDPFQGGSMYAKSLNRIFLETPPVVAHRNRITYLTQLLKDETIRIAPTGRPLKVYNLGCGPAREIQDYMEQSDLSDRAEFMLLDFNDETLAYAVKNLETVRKQNARRTAFRSVKKSVNQLIKEAVKPKVGSERYDLIYCAGLFDYLVDPVCKRLLATLYKMLEPGGLLLATNVSTDNPSKKWMEFVLEWHLIYRDRSSMETLVPAEVTPGHGVTRMIGKGVNIALEIRNPHDAS